MVNSTLKVLKGISVEFMEYLYEDTKRRKRTNSVLYMAGKDDQIATIAKLLDILHGSYRFNVDQIEAIT